MYLWEKHRKRLREALGGRVHSAIRFQDFVVRIEPERDGVYPVRVASPAGEGSSSFVFRVDSSGPSAEDATTTDAPEPENGSSPHRVTTRRRRGRGGRNREMGVSLFEGLFRGTTRDLFNQSLGSIRHDGRTGLRIKIHIDPEEPGLAALLRLPWELMYQQEKRRYLAQSAYTPIVRHLPVPQADVPLPIEGKLRVLVVIAAPTDLPHLKLEQETRDLEHTWALDSVDLRVLRHASFEDLQNRLREEDFHVLHFMGHGVFDEQTGQGALAFERKADPGEARTRDLVSGTSLGMVLRDEPTLRLVFLNACETAVAEEGTIDRHDPFAGVASAIVMAGAPAVVAMQAPIPDDVAIRFSGTVYELLSAGYPVESAVTAGRRIVEPEPDYAWATPVLFMRSDDGVIFKPTASDNLKSLLACLGWTPDELASADTRTHASMEDTLIDRAVTSGRILELLACVCMDTLRALDEPETAEACENIHRSVREEPDAEARHEAAEALVLALTPVWEKAPQEDRELVTTDPDASESANTSAEASKRLHGLRRLRACLDVAEVLAAQRPEVLPGLTLVPATLLHDERPVLRSRPRLGDAPPSVSVLADTLAGNCRHTLTELGLHDAAGACAAALQPPGTAPEHDPSVEAGNQDREAPEPSDEWIGEACGKLETILDEVLDQTPEDQRRGRAEYRRLRSYRDVAAALHRRRSRKELAEHLRLAYAVCTFVDAEATGRWRAWIRRMTPSTTVGADGTLSHTYQEELQPSEGSVELGPGREVLPNIAGSVKPALLAAARDLPRSEGAPLPNGFVWKVEEVSEPERLDVLQPLQTDPEAARAQAVDLIVGKLQEAARRVADDEKEKLSAVVSGSPDIVSISLDQIAYPTFQLGTWLYPFYVSSFDEGEKLLVVDGTAPEHIYVGDGKPDRTEADGAAEHRPRHTWSRTHYLTAGGLLALLLVLYFFDHLAAWLNG